MGKKPAKALFLCFFVLFFLRNALHKKECQCIIYEDRESAKREDVKGKPWQTAHQDGQST